MRCFRAIFGLLALFVGSHCGGLSSQQTSLAPEKTPRRFSVDSPTVGQRGVVTSAHPLATQAGMRILAQGGNAIDAVVATAATLGVVEPQSSGAGGAGILTLYMASTGELMTLDFWATTPSLVQMERMNEETKEVGILAAPVPGNVAGWAEAVKRYGKLSLAQVLQPAIEYAENGFPVNDNLSNSIRSTETVAPDQDRFFRRSVIRRHPTTARIFLPGGRIPNAGEILVQEDLAGTLRKIAAQGPDVFYRGEIADAFVKFSQENNGFFTKEDFARYQPRWAKPDSITYRGYEIHVVPAPTSGPTLLQTLNILEAYDLKSMDRFSADVTHLLSEAAKLASADEIAYIGDPAFISVPTSRLISKEYANEQRKRIRTDKAAVEVPVDTAETGGNTTALSVADEEGNVVTLIQTHLRGFGSGVVFGDTGVLFNDANRHIYVDGPNKFEPGKRLRHADVPVFVTRQGKPVLSLAASGAHTIWQTQLQVLINVIDYGMNIQEAISAPRIAISYGYNAVGDGLKHVEDFAYGELSVEQDYLDAEVAEELKRRGHIIVNVQNIGSVQGIQIDSENGVLMGGADPRRGAQASAW